MVLILSVIPVISITRDHLVTGGGSKRNSRRVVFLIVCALAFEAWIDRADAPGLDATEMGFDQIRREPTGVHHAQ